MAINWEFFLVRIYADNFFVTKVTLSFIKIPIIAPRESSLLAAIWTKRRLGHRDTPIEFFIFGVDLELLLTIFAGWHVCLSSSPALLQFLEKGVYCLVFPSPRFGEASLRRSASRRRGLGVRSGLINFF